MEALLLLMKSSLKKGCKSLQIYGDSELVIRWMKGENQILKSGLFNMAILLKDIANIFYQASFFHVYRKHNSKVDTLSKTGLEGKLEQVVEDEHKNGTIVSSIIFSLNDA
jgi:ribonuclease HI